jgi:S-formylglutathione hydrolase
MSTSIEIKSRTRVFGGYLLRVSHLSNVTNTPMTFAVYLPEESPPSKVPYLLYLSGLTCTDENVCQKGGHFRDLAINKVWFAVIRA